MAVEQSSFVVGLEAAADLSTSQYLAVVLTSTARRVNLVGSQGVRGTGILYNKPAAAGRDAEVAVAGIVKWKAGETITPGVLCTVGADNRCEIALSGDFIWGRTVTGGADGEIIEVLLGNDGVL